VQTFYPSPMATATAMYHTGLDPLRASAATPQRLCLSMWCAGERRRRLHKAFLRWHDAKNWPLLREALQAMGRADLIGNGKHHLIPARAPQGPRADAAYRAAAATAAGQPRGPPDAGCAAASVEAAGAGPGRPAVGRGPAVVCRCGPAQRVAPAAGLEAPLARVAPVAGSDAAVACAGVAVRGRSTSTLPPMQPPCAAWAQAGESGRGRGWRPGWASSIQATVTAVASASSTISSRRRRGNGS
jgi:hypothetical protein